MKKDLSLLYLGGTGGFFLLHLLLLSDEKFYCNGYENIDSIIKKQWSKDFDNWKSRETWPSNYQTYLKVTHNRKLFFHCHEYVNWEKSQDQKIFLYTNLETQLALSKLKKSFIYIKDKVNLVDKLEEKAYSTSIQIENVAYHYLVPELISKSDYAIKLQSLLKNPDYELQKIGITINDKQKSFIDFWVDLHPNYILKLLKDA